MSARISWLDVRLGLRMLVRHPALTIVGGLGMAVGIAISVGFFSFTEAYVYPDVPLPEGDRIVALENRDLVSNNEERRSLHDFVTWREELRTVQDLAAFRTVRRNLITGDAPPLLVPVAEMTAAGFEVARVPPLFGRYLVEDDERPGAPDVVVIGYDVWQTRFLGDANVLGRTIRLGAGVHTIIGVMPADFRFPENHQYWVPLRARASEFERREGPALYIFGRLAPGASLARAQAELDAIGQRTSAEFPLTHAQLRPMAMPYVHSLGDIQGIGFWPVLQMNLMMSLLLVVIALNVAVLVYARTAARHREIAVRSALGASRGRVVLQLFVEALVLSLIAAAAGLGLAQATMQLGIGILDMEFDVGMPFWMDFGLRPETIVFTLGLAVLAAVIVGVLPALQATGPRLQATLREGTGASMKLGRTWALLIVMQVAIAVAMLPAALHMGWNEIRRAATSTTYPDDEYLYANVRPEEIPDVVVVEGEEDAAPDDEEFGRDVAALMRRLEAEPAVTGVSFQASLPDRAHLIRVEGVEPPVESPMGHGVDAIGMHPGLLELYGARVLAGRTLTMADADENANAVVVNATFVHRVLGDAEPIGRRIRHVSSEERAGETPVGPPQWFQIVGVVEDLERNPADPEAVRPLVAYPVSAEQAGYASVIMRLRGTAPAEFAPRLRELTAAVDPTLRLGTVRSLADRNRQQQLAAQLVGLAVGLVLLVVLLLSAAGIYAMMSFTVTQRRREIGIRSALGAEPATVLRSIFARSALHVGAGVLLGVSVALLLEWMSGGEMMGGMGLVLLPLLALLMTITGILAAVGPARRGLKIQPTEALKADA